MGAAEEAARKLADEITREGAKETVKNIMGAWGGGFNVGGATNWSNMGKYGAIIGGITAVGTLAHGINKIGERKTMQKGSERSEINLRKRRRSEYDDRMAGFERGYQPPRTDGLVQNLYNNRSGHSNSWGGRKY